VKKYYLYLITNLVNGNIYVGKRTCNCIPEKDNKYIGSSKLLKLAVKKYGIENFRKEILRECNSLEELNMEELNIVNSQFVTRKDTYNMHIGGKGGWNHINNIPKEDRPNIKSFKEKVRNGKIKPFSSKNWLNAVRASNKRVIRGIAGRRGHTLSKEQKESISKASIGNTKWKYNKHKFIHKDEREETNFIITTYNEKPEGFIFLYEWKKRNKKTKFSWYNDGTNNYFLKEDNKKILFLIKGRLNCFYKKKKEDAELKV